jgi:hypothetical protein
LFPLILLYLANQDLERAFGARFRADVAGDTLEGHFKVIRVKHNQLCTETDAAKAADAFFLINAHDSVPIAVDGIGSAHIDAFAALRAFARPVSPVVFDDSDG